MSAAAARTRGVRGVIMAAMMLPSATPAIVTYQRMARAEAAVSPLLFAGGYLVVWGGAGLAA